MGWLFPDKKSQISTPGFISEQPESFSGAVARVYQNDSDQYFFVLAGVPGVFQHSGECDDEGKEIALSMTDIKDRVSFEALIDQDSKDRLYLIMEDSFVNHSIREGTVSLPD